MRVVSAAIAAFLCAQCVSAGAPITFGFSAGITSDMVLQRAPAKAAVYGIAPQGAEVSIAVAGDDSYTVQAETLNGAFKAFLHPAKAGGVYTITATCTSGCTDEHPQTLERVTFGDVFFCSGQSNMQVPVAKTFSHNSSAIAVLSKGKYGNIRFYQVSQGSNNTPQYVTQPHGTWYNVTYAAGLLKETDNVGRNYGGPYQSFSAACMYFAMNLVDLTDESVPFGMMESAVGGTLIEAWVDNSTYSSCASPDSPNHSNLYYSMVAPFVNMTVNGFIWYQGENNVGGDPGNAETGVGYSCFQVAIVELWRQVWSAVSGTTNPLASFGIVSLAAGGAEGHQPHMSHFRWAQTGNYGVLPNEKMPNTYLAHAYDIGDPWAIGGLGTHNCTNPDPTQWAPDCIQWNISDWAPALRPMFPLALLHDEGMLLNAPIHPRLKWPVGRRLATAYKNLMLGGTDTYTGPTLAGCTLDTAAETVAIRYNTTLLRNDKIMLQPFNGTGVTDSQSMMVCTGAYPGANASSCACSQWGNVNGTPHCDVGPSDLYRPSAEELAKGDTTGPIRGSFKPNEMWQSAPLRLTGTNTVEIDLKAVNTTGGVFAVKYAWMDTLDFCCADARFQEGYLACTPGACPIMTDKTNLPGNQFFATLENNKCKCLAPATCDN